MSSTYHEKTAIPTPMHINTAWQPPVDMSRPLTSFQEQLVLSIFPPHSHILSARFHRKERLPCPIWVEVALPDGQHQKVILRMDYTPGGVEHESAVLPLLAKHGLPVPTILAGPVLDPTQPEAELMTILSILPGKDLLGWSWNAPLPDVKKVFHFILEGIDLLHSVTEAISQEPIALQLPHKTLFNEWEALIERGGPWLKEDLFKDALNTLQPIVSHITTPLAFSNSDYNQGNFLFDGEKLTGLIDFSGPCFEDPHIGMAMYDIYSWYPFNEAGILEHYLEHHNLTFTDFAPRLALRCLRTLQQQIPIVGGENITDEFESLADYRRRVLILLEHAMTAL